MSRVDDALRRAAEAEAKATWAATESTSGTPALADDIEALSREAFPIEMDEHRKSTRVAHAVPPPAPSATPSPAVPPREAKVPETAPAKDVPATRPTLFNRIDSRLAGKVVVDAEIVPASREQYRRLAATLHHAQASHGLKVVMVTSALVGEGKTLTSSNLALTLSESYKKNVLLIDGDLRRPSLHALFGLESSPGLSEGLTAGEDHRLSVRQVSPRLGVLTAGRPSSDPIASLTSTRMKRVIEEARDTFDWVIIDTPPIALLTDANLLAAMADGTLLVVKAGSTPWDLAQRAVQAIGRERTLGVVLNRATSPTHDSGYGYYDDYTAPVTEAAPSP